MDDDSKKSLLIIGAGAEQVPAYHAAKARGLIVIGTDLNPDAPAFKYADHRLIASTRNADETLDVVRSFAESHKIDGVMTIANDVPYTVAVVAHAFGLPSIPIDSARLVSNKIRMKEAFLAANVQCPWFAKLADAKELHRIHSENPYKKFIIKPIDGRGSRGVLLIKSDTDLNWAFSEASQWGESGEVIVEEFIEGLQLSTESFLIDGISHTPAIAERNYEYLDHFSPYVIENGGTIPAILTDDLKQRIDLLIANGAEALGVRDGIVKGDLVINQHGEPLIIELALRLSGGWFATHQIPSATGVNLVDAVISYSLGETVSQSQLIPTKKCSTAIRYWFPPEGTLSSVEGEQDLARLPGLISYGFFRQVGDHQPRVRMHPDRFGYLLVEADDRETALIRVSKGLDLIRIGIS